MIPKSGQIVEIGVPGECAKIHLFGATIISWTSQNTERLFLSKKAHLDGSKPIRGGIPLVFPQFGPSDGRPFPLPQHGFARQMWWQVTDKTKTGVVLECKSHDNMQITKDFPFPFTLRYSVEIEEKTLKMTACVINDGPGEFSFDWLYHTYFLADISSSEVEIAPSSKHFKDANGKEICEKLTGINRSVIVNTGKSSRIEIISKNLPDYVIWNPGNRSMDDMEKGEENEMLCVEAGSIHPPCSNKAALGKSKEFSQTLRVLC